MEWRNEKKNDDDGGDDDGDGGGDDSDDDGDDGVGDVVLHHIPYERPKEVQEEYVEGSSRTSPYGSSFQSLSYLLPHIRQILQCILFVMEYTEFVHVS